VQGRPLMLGGVQVPFEQGLLGHSDGDVLIHAIIDALLGAAGLGDIGQHFPPTEERLRGVSSLRLLREVLQMLAQRGLRPLHVDATVVAEAPKLAPHLARMKEALQQAGLASVSIKAKSNEGMGLVGSGQGLAAFAVCLLSA